MPVRGGQHILFLIPEDWYVCSHRLPLLRGAVAAGWDVTVVTRVDRHGPAIEATGARVIHARLQRGFQNPLKDLAGLVNLIRIYRRERPDIVHHVTPKSVLFGSLAAFLCRVPRVVNALAGLGFLFASSGIAARIVRSFVIAAFRFLLGRRNSYLIVQNRDDESYFGRDLKVPAGRIRLIRGAGVDIEEFSPAEAEPGPPYRACLVGRLLIDKGIAETVEAARLIRAERDDIEILIAGEPDPANPSGVPAAQLEDWKRVEGVQLLGRVGEVADLLRTCHIGLLPSYREGLPKSLLEAASCGLPIVATDVPGCREVCLDDENGILIPPRDPKSIAEAILRLAADPALRSRYGRRSRELIVQELGEKQVVEATLALYREIAP